MSSFHQERDAYLEAKFDELDAEGKGYLNKQETFEMFKQVHELDQGKHRKARMQEFTIQHFDRMFYLLNSSEQEEVKGSQQNGSKLQQNINNTAYPESTLLPSANSTVMPSILGRITKAEFMKIFEV